MEPTWVQHEPSLSQVGANLGPCWVQRGSSRSSCSNYEGILRPLWAYTTQDAKNHPKFCRILFQKVSKIGIFKAPEKQFFIGKRRSGSKSRKNDHEAKPYQFGRNLGAIFGLGVLGRPLEAIWGVWSQHKAISSHLGANLMPSGAKISPT